MTTSEQNTHIAAEEPMPIMLDVFKPDNTDIKWMTRLYLESAKKEHFNFDIRNRKDIALIKRNIKSLVEKQSLIDFGLETQTLIFEYKNKKIGYVVMSSVRNEPDAVEIHLLIVDRKYRGKTYGRHMLHEIIRRWHSHVNIYARCYAASFLMKNMLIKSGFGLAKVLDDESSLYLLKNESPDNTISGNEYDLAA